MFSKKTQQGNNTVPLATTMPPRQKPREDDYRRLDMNNVVRPDPTYVSYSGYVTDAFDRPGKGQMFFDAAHNIIRRS